jgi:hypothetical protein
MSKSLKMRYIGIALVIAAFFIIFINRDVIQKTSGNTIEITQDDVYTKIKALEKGQIGSAGWSIDFANDEVIILRDDAYFLTLMKEKDELSLNTIISIDGLGIKDREHIIVSYSPNGRYALIGSNKKIYVWDISGKKIRDIGHIGINPSVCAWAGTSEYLALTSANKGEAVVYNVFSGEISSRSFDSIPVINMIVSDEGDIALEGDGGRCIYVDMAGAHDIIDQGGRLIAFDENSIFYAIENNVMRFLADEHQLVRQMENGCRYLDADFNRVLFGNERSNSIYNIDANIIYTFYRGSASKVQMFSTDCQKMIFSDNGVIKLIDYSGRDIVLEDTAHPNLDTSYTWLNSEEIIKVIQEDDSVISIISIHLKDGTESVLFEMPYKTS